MELWKDIIGYENLYEISNHGKINKKTITKINKRGFQQTFQGQKMTLSNRKGYLGVWLRNIDGNRKAYDVHRLVAQHFVDGYFEGAVVNHIDLNKHNNHYLNLEWITQQENIQHYHDNHTKGV